MRSPDAEPELAAGLLTAALRTCSPMSSWRARVRHKFSIRNTNGYALCALSLCRHAAGHLPPAAGGSEGTLAFIAEAVHRHAALLPPSPRVGLDRTAVHRGGCRAGAGSGGRWRRGRGADGRPCADRIRAGILRARRIIGKSWIQLGGALLVEFGADDAAGTLMPPRPVSPTSSPRAKLATPLEFTRDRALIELDWHVREPATGHLTAQLRPPGTALVIEDVCVPPV